MAHTTSARIPASLPATELASRVETACALMRHFCAEGDTDTLFVLGESLDELQHDFDHIGNSAAAALTSELIRALLHLAYRCSASKRPPLLLTMNKACASLHQHLAGPPQAGSSLILQINELRAIQDKPLLTESRLFQPDLERLPSLERHTHPGQAPGLEETARLILPYFQAAHRGWKQNSDALQNRQQMRLAVRSLKSASTTPKTHQTWWIASALFDELADGRLPFSCALQYIVREYEHFIARLSHGASGGIEHAQPCRLLKNTLFYLGQTGAKGTHAGAVARFYRLDEQLPNDLDLATHYRLHEQQRFLFRKGIIFELENTLHHTEHNLKSVSGPRHAAVQQLQQARQRLHQAAKSLRLLNRHVEAMQLQQQIDRLDTMLQQAKPPTPTELQALNTTIAHVRQQLHITPTRPESTAPLDVFIRQCLHDVTTLEQLITQHGRNAPVARIEATIGSLQRKAELMAIDEFGATIELLRHYIDNIARGDHNLSGELIDILTEFCQTTRKLLEDLHQTGADHHQPVANKTDEDELRTGFHQEASQMLDQISSLAAIWPEQNDELKRLLRRLQGTARMAGVEAIAELARATERLLTQAPSDPPRRALRRQLLITAGKGLRRMLEQLARNTPVTADPGLLARLRSHLTAQSEQPTQATTSPSQDADWLDELAAQLTQLEAAADFLEHKIAQVDIGERSRAELRAAFIALEIHRQALAKLIASQSRQRSKNETTRRTHSPGSLLVRSGAQVYAIDASKVAHIQPLASAPDNLLQQQPLSYTWQGRKYRIYQLDNLLNNADTKPSPAGEEGYLLLLQNTTTPPLALLVDEIATEHSQPLLPNGPQLGQLKGVRGVARVEPHGIVLILDIEQLIRQADKPQRKTGQQDTPPQTGHAMPTIMVIDDSITTRTVTERLLKHHGCAVLSASHGAQAGQLISQHRPHLVLLDLDSSSDKPLTLLRQLRAQHENAALPIIATSIQANSKQRQAILEAGADAFLPKPYLEHELISHIQKLTGCALSPAP